MLIAAAIVAAGTAAGAGAWALTSHQSNYGQSGGGCVNVSIASSMGGAIEHACGTAARDWCHAASTQHDAHAEAVQAQCRVAGILR